MSTPARKLVTIPRSKKSEPSAAALRQRRRRARRRAGLCVLQVVVDLDVRAALVQQGIIDIESTEHDPALEDAIGALLRRLAGLEGE